MVNMGHFQIKYLGMDPKTRKEKSVKKSTYARPPREERKE
jgi:polyribonucleotide nucleotidyltransferase